MQTLNRHIAPPIKLEPIQFPIVEINNHMHYIRGASQEYTFLQLVFPAGKIQSALPLMHDTCADMLLCGTSKLNAFKLNETLDYYGASIEPIPGDDDITLRVYCLNKQLENVLPLLLDMIDQSVFPEDELRIMWNKWKQRQAIQMKKTDYVASRLIRSSVFGNTHPYGKFIELEDFDCVCRDDVFDFYKNFIQHKACDIIVSGKLDDADLDKIDAALNQKRQAIPFSEIPITQSKQAASIYEEREEQVQTSIRVGRLCKRIHEEAYIHQHVLTTLLGGYFSSRLMNNLREDKGYTYGVGAYTLSKRNGAMFEISTEVNKEFRNEACDEIKIELKRFIDEAIDNEEMKRVKNYLLGQMMRSLDGPIKTAKLYKTLHLHGVDFSCSNAFEAAIQDMNAQTLQEVASEFFSEDQMHWVCVG